MTSKHANITAILDANVLYPAPLRDYLLYLASLKVYFPLWTESIQEEWARNLMKARPDINRTSVEATQLSMNRYFERSNIKDYESIVAGLSLPDPDDRHVLAAAIKGQAQIIVTANLKDFPRKNLAPYDISATHPDDFVLACIDRDKTKAIKALTNQVKYLKNPPIPIEKVLENLKRSGLVKSAIALASLL